MLVRTRLRDKLCFANGLARECLLCPILSQKHCAESALAQNLYPTRGLLEHIHMLSEKTASLCYNLIMIKMQTNSASRFENGPAK